MTIVYFVRHAESNYMDHDDMSRELTEKGIAEYLGIESHIEWAQE